MPRVRSALLLLVAFNLALLSPQAEAQGLLATVPAGTTPVALAINSVSNKIFVVNQGSNSVTVIDGASNGIAAIVPVGQSPAAVAVNPVTNKIYVVNQGGNAALTVIDGATYSTTTVVSGGGVGGQFAMPQAVAVDPLTNRIYFVKPNGNAVIVIDGSTNSIIATVMVNLLPQAVVINPVTNKIYVANMGSGNVSVIDGTSNSLLTGVYTGVADPFALAVDSESNRIYVANLSGFVSVIDGGAGNSLLANVPVGAFACAIAVNAVSNKIYVANAGDGTVSVIDGSNNTSTSVALGGSPASLSVDAATNKIYVGNAAGNLTMLDGRDDSIRGSVIVGSYPDAVIVNLNSNRIYVANQLSYTVSVIGGASSDPLQFIPLTPCRVADTRNPNGPFGGPAISGGTSRDFAIPNSACDVPPTAAAYSLNVSVVPSGPLGYLTVWPTGLDQPAVSTLNSDGRVKANAAIVPAGAGGAVSVFASNTTNVVLDINGYFAAVSGSTLAFYPLAPCRVVDTRWANGPLGGPFLQGGAAGRDFPVTSSVCAIPASAQAYSFNFSAVPRGPLGYLTTWPAGQAQPGVSTLNAMTGVVTANAAIVPAGSGSDIDVFVSNDSDVVIDINGYFAPAASGGLSLYGTAPCRALDTRNTTGAFSGTIGVLIVVPWCGVPSIAQAFVLSATVVPQWPLGYLTLWPDGEPQPTVSTLNAVDGAVTSNLAIVPTFNGWIEAFASNLTQLILDSSSYFGP